jgi:hypothetical protein
MDRYPTQDDVAFARKHDATYGHDAAPHLRAGAPLNITSSLGSVLAAANNGAAFASEPRADQKLSDVLYAAWLASQRSPVAAMGFDPRRMHATPPGSPGNKLTAAGFYRPAQDDMWIDGRYPSVPVHESMHRGAKLMRDKGARTPSDEESVVRMLMLQHFGGVEKNAGEVNDRQVQNAEGLLKNPRNSKLLQGLEQQAAEMYHRRGRPMGPR